MIYLGLGLEPPWGSEGGSISTKTKGVTMLRMLKSVLKESEFDGLCSGNFPGTINGLVLSTVLVI